MEVDLPRPGKTIRFTLLFLLLLYGTGTAGESEALAPFEFKAMTRATQCRDEVLQEFDKFLSRGRLNLGQLFDTFYIPVPGTHPQKFKTQYDGAFDEVLRILFDKYLEMDERYLYVVATDRNGYVPTHNSRYSKPLTDDPDYNARNNRTKQIHNDRVGLAAARSRRNFLLQNYQRDTGEVLHDLSVPIVYKGKHWGAIRLGFR